MIKPNLFIVGHTRSGTTSLKSYLEQHPDVFIINTKKGYFGYYTDFKSQEEYLEIFANVKNKKIIGEKCTDYLSCPTTAQKLKDFSPESKIIIMLRNPIEQIYSLHRYMLNETMETYENLEDALDAEDSRKKESSLNPKKYHPHLFYREQAKYTGMVKKYLDYFDKEQIFIIIFDDMVKDVAKVYKNTCDFLEIDDKFQPTFEIQNARRAYRSKQLQILFKKTPDSAKKILRKIPYSQDIYTKINYPEVKSKGMDPVLKKKLQIELLPEIENLSKLLGRDLTFWCKN